MANINREQAVHLDIILQTLVDKTVNVRSVQEINENLIIDKSFDYCLSLFYVLSEHYPRLLYPISDLGPDEFWPTEYVTAFLHDGGFTNLYDTAAAKQEIDDERQKLNDEKLNAEVDIVKFQKGLGKKLLIWGFVVSVVSIIASVLTTVATNHNDKQTLLFDTVSLKKQLQMLDSRLQNLEHKQVKDTMPKK